MLEGLEVREVDISKLQENKDFRTDSQFYTREFKKNPNLNYTKIGNIIKSSQYGISIGMNEDGKGYPIYRMNEIHNMLCDLTVEKYADISKEEYEKFALHNGDVLFNRTNSFEWVGRTGIYYQNDDVNRTFASYLVKFIPDENIVLPEYLCAFLNSKFGMWDIKRRARQSINQTNVNPEEVKEIEIPLLSMDFQSKIKDCLAKSNKLRIEANNCYLDADRILSEELGVHKLKIDHSPISIKQIQESFLKSGRLDSEYYLKRYEDYTKAIQAYHGGYDVLPNICQINDTLFNPQRSTTYKYVELNDIGLNGDITGCITSLGKDLPSRARRIIMSGEIILSSIEGSLQSVAMVNEEYHQAICSTGFYRLLPHGINAETLLLLLKSDPIQIQLKQNCSGTILTAINRNDLQRIILPKIVEPIQNEIAIYVQKSVSLRQQAKQLLEDAKHMVEFEIEKKL